MDSVRTSKGQAALAAAVIVTVLVGASLWAERNIPAGLLPHGVCFTWLPSLVWLHVLSDATIGLAYLSIPITLVYLVRKRRDLPFHWMFLLFGIFIVSCGATHWVGIWTVWNPDYWFAGSVKAITAAASLLTAAALIPLVPKVLTLPTTEDLRLANDRLQREVAQRRAAEEELRQIHLRLEERIEERTRELVQARTAAEALRAEADEANRMKDNFLAKVSHELRTPLQAMLSWTNVLAANVGERTPAKTAADRIAHNLTAQARLIDDLLDVSRILSGKLKLELAPVDPRALIQQALAVVRPQAEKAGVEIDVDVDVGGVTMTTDGARLEQVLWNLLANAIQASDAGQRVRLTARVLGDRMRLQVIDTGRGIARDDLASIFEPFRQANLANAHRGLGLGLAIARSIVGLVGGTIHAMSEGPGHGATFTVDLPLVAGKPLDHQDARALSDEDRRALAPLRVLYVEDNAELADAVAASLQSWVQAVDVAYDYASAIDRIDGERYDVIVCDINLGERRNGADLLREVRQRQPSLPAVALSAFGAEEDRAISKAAGFAIHLVKPVSAVMLASTISRTVRGDDNGRPRRPSTSQSLPT
jgi:signal transduction histidine kinase/ActR/RegA family two-component response regulator